MFSISTLPLLDKGGNYKDLGGGFNGEWLA